ncbi:hypothetical protein [Syntrophus aciditrophicus]|uniref:hypothetical protein n=1 Tax=Syntrophus aciditrophicus TaxID=316277 RepID=UPI0002F596F0|nr:hypothetical protein [Syntrophus aciditrophicus]OPY18785.1 MAG: hypothetical protein A4E74_00435 [Syntrophus sp. PtaB.Bin075]
MKRISQLAFSFFYIDNKGRFPERNDETDSKEKKRLPFLNISIRNLRMEAEQYRIIQADQKQGKEMYVAEAQLFLL